MVRSWMLKKLYELARKSGSFAEFKRSLNRCNPGEKKCGTKSYWKCIQCMELKLRFCERVH